MTAVREMGLVDTSQIAVRKTGLVETGLGMVHLLQLASVSVEAVEKRG